jgi:nitrite reductase (NADH) small subunit
MSSDDVSETQVTGVTLVPDSPRPTRWERACRLADLFPERGAAALFGEVQVALFRLPADPDHGEQVYAVQNLDPFSGAYVMSRGIVGTRAGVPTVASPVYKQVFSLVTGECLVAADKTPKDGLPPDLTTYEVEIRNGEIHVGLA